MLDVYFEQLARSVIAFVVANKFTVGLACGVLLTFPPAYYLGRSFGQFKIAGLLTRSRQRVRDALGDKY